MAWRRRRVTEISPAEKPLPGSRPSKTAFACSDLHDWIIGASCSVGRYARQCGATRYAQPARSVATWRPVSGIPPHLPERHVAIHLRLLRQTQHALADDVALDLVGAAADRGEVGVEGEEVGVL